MLFSDSYYTIKFPHQALIKDRGSKFIGFVFPVVNESEIKNHLLQLRKEHPNANHHCYAWRLGADKSAFRFNDDGEPSNTAGKPIYGQIQAKDLTNVLLVVVRYFGGTLLGVGGLINAYKTAAAEAINGAIILEKFILFEYRIEFDEDVINHVMRILKINEAKIISHTYENQNSVVFQIKKQNAVNLEKDFADLYTTKLNYLKIV